MPELKQVVVATAAAIGYAPTFKEALAQVLAGGGVPGEQQVFSTAGGQAGSSQTILQERISAANGHLRKYIELTAKGRLGEAGRELEQVRAILSGEARQ
jgi:uncharacterized membrane protein (UPF0182 family)